jgi:3-oxoacyl-[acyl-carrier protein] reductase
MLLKERTAVITGCNRGIGKAIMEKYAENGADIIACVRNKSNDFDSLMDEVCSQTGVSISPVYFDFSESEQVRAGIKEIVSLKRQIHILVNNAGVASGSIFHMTSMDELKRVFEINFFSQIQLSQGISRYMTRFKSGSIINISSVAGIIGDAGTTAYGASKAALLFATKTMATELGAMNIRVNAIAPSITETDMFVQMDETARTKLIDSSALKRPAKATEVADAALFLASDLSTFISGQVLRVDGGLTF